jgi:hypothetical protein
MLAAAATCELCDAMHVACGGVYTTSCKLHGPTAVLVMRVNMRP